MANRSRTILLSSGLLGALLLRSMMFALGDRYSINDVALPLTASGITALSGGVLASALAGFGLDGNTVFDRITPPTLGLEFSARSSSQTDETVPHGLSLTFAPTYRFGREWGRLRLIGRVATDLGQNKERDPRPQVGQAPPQPLALTKHETHGEVGLDFALYLAHRFGSNGSGRHSFELRYKPLLFLGHEQLQLGQEERSSTRVAITPLNIGIRWNLSPRQRFTLYLGPRWDFSRYGVSGSTKSSKPARGPMYGEAWFDIDIPFRNLSVAQRLGRSTVAAQFTLGYRHFRFGGNGINVGSYVGFFGHAVSRLSLRIRPPASRVAYQLALGASVGSGVHPHLRFGIVLPDIGTSR